jgi:hypothetical protein
MPVYFKLQSAVYAISLLSDCEWRMIFWLIWRNERKMKETAFHRAIDQIEARNIISFEDIRRDV